MGNTNGIKVEISTDRMKKIIIRELENEIGASVDINEVSDEMAQRLANQLVKYVETDTGFLDLVVYELLNEDTKFVELQENLINKVHDERVKEEREKLKNIDLRNVNWDIMPDLADYVKQCVLSAQKGDS